MGDWGEKNLLLGVMIPLRTGRGPPCMNQPGFRGSCHVLNAFWTVSEPLFQVMNWLEKLICNSESISRTDLKMVFIGFVWSNYSDLTRPHPKGSCLEGKSPINQGNPGWWNIISFGQMCFLGDLFKVSVFMFQQWVGNSRLGWICFVGKTWWVRTRFAIASW